MNDANGRGTRRPRLLSGSASRSNRHARKGRYQFQDCFTRIQRAGGLGAGGGLGWGWRLGGFRRCRGSQFLADGLAALAQGELVFSNAVEARFVSVNT